MEDISLHILDITQNSIRAGATKVMIEIVEKARENTFVFVISDNGSGMTAEKLSRVHDPFFTTRTTRRVGLGIPLLEQTAEQAGGGLTVTSAPGEGTTVEARYRLDSIDRPPVGDVAATIWTLIITNPRVEFEYRHERDGARFELNTEDLKDKLRRRTLATPQIAKALRKYVADNEKRVAAADEP